MRAFLKKGAAATLLLLALAPPAAAAQSLDGASLPWPLALPFAAMLLSIALGPLVVKEWWHIHYEKAAAFLAMSAIEVSSLSMVLRQQWRGWCTAWR